MPCLTDVNDISERGRLSLRQLRFQRAWRRRRGMLPMPHVDDAAHRAFYLGIALCAKMRSWPSLLVPADLVCMRNSEVTFLSLHSATKWRTPRTCWARPTVICDDALASLHSSTPFRPFEVNNLARTHRLRAAEGSGGAMHLALTRWGCLCDSLTVLLTREHSYNRNLPPERRRWRRPRLPVFCRRPLGQCVCVCACVCARAFAPSVNIHLARFGALHPAQVYTITV
jgi:hypothetical protein